MSAHPGGVRRLLRLLSCIRFEEVLVLQGAPLLGAVFAMGQLSRQGAATLALLAAGNGLLVAHVFLLNDWSGVQHDLCDPARNAGVFLNRGIRRGEIAALLLVLLALALLALGRLGRVPLGLGLLIAAASALYSIPRVYLKGVPLASSLLHLISGLIHFLLGYSAFRPPDARGLQIGLFFAAVFSAGHLTQEIRDHEADLRNGIRSNAVRFGKRRNLLASLALFTIANALLLVLALRGTVPPPLAWVVALYPLQLYWTLQALHAGLSHESVRRLQLRYRALYAAIGAAMAGSVFLP